MFNRPNEWTQREELFAAVQNGDLEKVKQGMKDRSCSDIHGLRFNHHTLASTAVHAKQQIILDYFYSLLFERYKQRIAEHPQNIDIDTWQLFNYKIECRQLNLNIEYDAKILKNILQTAAEFGSNDYVEYALNKLGANFTEQEHEFACGIAIEHHQLGCLKKLNEFRAMNYAKMLSAAAQEGDFDIIQYIAKEGKIDLKTFRDEHYFPLFSKACAAKEPLPLVQQLCELGFDPNADSDNKALYIAIIQHYNYPKLTEVLLSYGVNVNELCSEGETPIFVATLFSEEITWQLLKHDIDFFLGKSAEAIFNAFDNSNLSAVKKMLEKEPRLAKVKSLHGDFPIVRAIYAKDLEIVDLVLKSGADINIVKKGRDWVTPDWDSEGMTLLMYAKQYGNEAIFHRLEEAFNLLKPSYSSPHP